MISIKCPHCKQGLKVDEKKAPSGITSFPCPKCKNAIPMEYLEQMLQRRSDKTVDTVVVKGASVSGGGGLGQITVLTAHDTPEQVYPLKEGINIIGRAAKTSGADIGIQTGDKTMSRTHIKIEVKKSPRGGYFHQLSDNNSRNNTLYNGNNLESEDIIVLKDGDELVLGRTTVRFNE